MSNRGSLESLRTQLQYATNPQVKNFIDTFESFTRNGYWIKPDSVIRALLDTNTDSRTDVHAQALEEMMSRANLAKLLLDLVQLQQGGERATKLTTLTNHFPQAFVTLAGVDRDTGNMLGYTAETSRAAIALRTQLVIAIFQDGDGDPAAQDADRTLEDLLIAPWRRDESFHGEVVERIQRIQRYYLKNKASTDNYHYVDIRNLVMDYSWESCVQELFTWIIARRKELNDSVARKGGFDKITEALEQHITDHDLQRTQAAPEQIGMSSADGGTGQVQDLDFSSRTPSSRQELLRRMRQMSGRGPAKPSSSAIPVPESSILGLSAKAIQQVNEQRPAAGTRKSGTTPILSTLPQRKKRSIMDRQNGATRVADIDEDDDHDDRHISARAQVQLVDETERASSVGYQTDNRPSPHKRLQRAQPQIPTRRHRGSPRSAQAPRASEQIRDDGEEEEEEEEEAEAVLPVNTVQPRVQQSVISPAKKRRKVSQRQVQNVARDGDDAQDGDFDPNTEGEANDENQDPNDVDEEPPSTNYRDVNRLAKLATQEQKFNAPPPPQTRRPWTLDEEEMLIECIGKFGTGYKAIKDHDGENGNVLIDRSEVGLKDKARNIKVDYLK